MADIITMLKEDHAKVKDMFERLEASTERGTKTRTDVLARLAADLRVHMKFEEETFYPAVKEGADKEGRELTCEAYAEHEAATSVLEKLEGIAPSDEMWKANLMVLKENVQHHIKEEEKELFKHARSILSKEELRAMGEQYGAMKREPAIDGKSEKRPRKTAPEKMAKSAERATDDGKASEDVDASMSKSMTP